MKRREDALAKRHIKAQERLTEHTVRLPPLKVGDAVFIQNQTGNHPRRWHRTGVCVEVKQHDQYVIKVDGTGRLTLRNRKFLRKFTPYNHGLKSYRTPPELPTVEVTNQAPEDDNVAVENSPRKLNPPQTEKEKSPPVLTPNSPFTHRPHSPRRLHFDDAVDNLREVQDMNIPTSVPTPVRGVRRSGRNRQKVEHYQAGGV